MKAGFWFTTQIGTAFLLLWAVVLVIFIEGLSVYNVGLMTFGLSPSCKALLNKPYSALVTCVGWVIYSLSHITSRNMAPHRYVHIRYQANLYQKNDRNAMFE